MALRLAAPVLVAAALLAWLAGAGGLASLVLLAAIVAGATRLVLAVGDAAERGSGRFPVVTTAAGLVCLVAACALHVPVLAAGVFVLSALEAIGGAGASRPEVARRPEPVDLVEAPASRAA